MIQNQYSNVSSSTLSLLVVHPRVFRIITKGEFNVVTFCQKVPNQSTAYCNCNKESAISGAHTQQLTHKNEINSMKYEDKNK